MMRETQSLDVGLWPLVTGLLGDGGMKNGRALPPAP